MNVVADLSLETSLSVTISPTTSWIGSMESLMLMLVSLSGSTAFVCSVVASRYVTPSETPEICVGSRSACRSEAAPNEMVVADPSGQLSARVWLMLCSLE